MTLRLVRFKPMSGRVAVIADYNGLWVQHEFDAVEAAELAGEFAWAIVESERITAKASAAWDLVRKK